MLAVFVVETNSRNKSDYLYIKKYLDTFFETGDSVIRPVYLGGKDNYRRKAPQKEIRSWISKYLSTDRADRRTVVVYCIDTDDISSGPDADVNRRKAREIEDFCSRNGYRFIWFHEVVEQTFVGKRVSNKEKGTVAESFARKNLQAFDRSKLRCANYNECREGTSNIDLVLHKYFSEKVG